jgi:tRNA G18 (ribose-2'-O)-methylase SpoU
MTTHGVPPHPLPWPTGDQYDPQLLAEGDPRNVEDRYRYWTVTAIRLDMSKRAFPVEIAIENWQHDFNIGTIVRNANAFNVRKVHIIGKRHWNRRGAMMTEQYLPVVHHPDISSFISATHHLHRVAVDNLPGAVESTQYEYASDTVYVFGGEGPGISDELRIHCEMMIKIPQYGSTRSVNVGVASGILLYKWVETYTNSSKIEQKA